MNRIACSVLLWCMSTFLAAAPHAEEQKSNQGNPASGSIEEEFISLVSGNSTAGWTDGVRDKDSILTGKRWHRKHKFADFHLKFEFKLQSGAKSGIGIRSAVGNTPAFDAIEIQVLDDSAEKYASLKPWQYHGSIYGVVAAKQGHLKPVGDWNQQEIIAKGGRITVILNGTKIVDTE